MRDTPASPARKAASTAPLLVAALLAPTPVLAADRVACLHGAEDAGALAQQTLPALRIETRKAELPWRWERLDEGEPCPEAGPGVHLLSPVDAQLRLPGSEPVVLPLEAIPSEERARSLARSVVVALSLEESTAAEEPAMILLDDTLLELPPEIELGPEAWVRLGGGLRLQPDVDLESAGFMVEVGADLWQGRASMSARGEIAQGDNYELQEFGLGPLRETELLVLARGGILGGPLWLRAGMGAGLYQGTLVINELDPWRDDQEWWDEEKIYSYLYETRGELDVEERRKQLLWALTLELEAALRPWDRWEVGLQLGGRYLPDVLPWGFDRILLLDGAPWSFGGRLTLGYRL